MRTLRLTLMVLGLLSVGTLAQESEQQAPRDAPPQAPPREEAPPPEPAEPPARPGRAADDVFIPTEELAADEAVTYPVDI